MTNRTKKKLGKTRCLPAKEELNFISSLIVVAKELREICAQAVAISCTLAFKPFSRSKISSDKNVTERSVSHYEDDVNTLQGE